MRAILFKEAALVAAAILLACFCFLLADFFLLSRFVPDISHIYKRHDHGWYTLKPNLDDALYGWGKRSYPVSTDKNGFRIERAGTANQSAEFIFLGDSFTFGINGPWDETFVGMFEKKSGRSVINAGVGSYSPSAYLYQYKTALSAGRLAPGHKVIVGLDISDVQDEAVMRDDGPDHPRQSAQRAALQPQRSAFQEFFSSNFLATRAIYRFIRYGRPRLATDETGGPPAGSVVDRVRSAFTWKDWRSLERGRPDDTNFEEKLAFGPNGVNRGLEKIRASMLLLSELVRANDGEIWILSYPWPAQLKYGTRVFDWQKFTASLCVEMMCRGLVDTFPAFSALAASRANWYSDLYVVGDLHFNKFGNEIIANQLLITILGLSSPTLQ